MRARTLAVALALVAAAARAARAGAPMESASYDLRRNDVTSGGTSGSSSNNKVTGAVAEAQTAARTSSNYRLVPGGMALFSFPGRVTDLSAIAALTAGATQQWTTPGYDGSLGPDLLTGSSYYIRIASYTAPDTFSVSYATVLSTGPTGTAPGAVVSSVSVGLVPNTTWFSTLFVADADGDLSFMSNMSTFTTLANPPRTLANTYLNVFYTSATLAWGALEPPGASSGTGEGYSLEASTTNFGALSPGGVILSSQTTSVLASTLTVAGLDLGTTVYFRVGSYNWSSSTNYISLQRLNFQIDPSTFGISFGAIDPMLYSSTVSVSSVVVTNHGNLPVTLQLYGSTATAGTPWTLAASPGVEQVSLQGLFNSVAPPQASFSTALLTSTQTATAVAFAGDQTAVQIPAGASRTLWFRFLLPTSTIQANKQNFVVNVLGIYP